MQVYVEQKNGSVVKALVLLAANLSSISGTP